MKKLLLFILLFAGLSFQSKAQAIYFTIDSLNHMPYVCANATYGATVKGWRSSYAVVLDSTRQYYRNDSLYLQLYFNPWGGPATPVPYSQPFSVLMPANIGTYKIVAQGFYQNQLHKTLTSSIIICNASTVMGRPEKAANLSIKIYPNPVQDELIISCIPENEKIQNVIVSDLTGKTCFSGFVKNRQEHSLNIKHLPKGIYLLQLQTDKGTAVKKFVKE